MKKLIVSFYLTLLMLVPASAQALSLVPCEMAVKDSGETIAQCECWQQKILYWYDHGGATGQGRFNEASAQYRQDCRNAKKDNTAAIWTGIAIGSAVVMIGLIMYRNKHGSKSAHSRRKK